MKRLQLQQAQCAVLSTFPGEILQQIGHHLKKARWIRIEHQGTAQKAFQPVKKLKRADPVSVCDWLSRRKRKRGIFHQFHKRFCCGISQIPLCPVITSYNLYYVKFCTKTLKSRLIRYQHGSQTSAEFTCERDHNPAVQSSERFEEAEQCSRLTAVCFNSHRTRTRGAV